MKTSEVGIKMITAYEGCMLKAYKPVAAEQYWTIGYGHYGPDVKQGQKITKAEAEELLKKDLAKFERLVMKYDHIYHWNQNEFDAMVSFAYNVGSIDQLTAYGTRNKATIAGKIPLYNKGSGKVLQGLVRRRSAEQALFMDKTNIAAKADKSACPTLRKGDKGEYVKMAQSKIADSGILLTVDGIFGDKTYMAVIAYQGANDLTKDGVIGPKTWASLLA